MNTYFSTFISGFSSVVGATLPRLLPNTKVISLLDGLVIFETTAPVERVKRIEYFNNSFLLVNRLTQTEGWQTNFIVKKLSANLDLSEVAPLLPEKKRATFRIVVSRENELTHVDRSIVHSVEEKITAQTYLSVSPLKADYEFWFLIRSEGESLLGVRITGLSDRPGDQPQKGELRSTLASFLCILSQPSDEDTVLDPFAGHGSIPVQRAMLGGYKRIVAGDSDAQLVARLRQRLQNISGTEVYKMDALHMSTIKDRSITTVITDPPWGVFDTKITDYKTFYEGMLREFARVLTLDGTVVILTSRKELLPPAALQATFRIIEEHDILVSGKKAAVYVLRFNQE